MSSFWPKDLFADYILSPFDIMTNAGKELTNQTKVLRVDIQQNRLGDRIVLAFIINNSAYGIALNLFEVSHRPDKTYPAVIEPPIPDIPEFLQRERRIPGSTGFSAISAMSLSITGGSPDKIIKNEWVCATPEEFTEKLTKLLALDIVKSNILSLLAPTPAPVVSVNIPENTHSSEEAQDIQSQ